MSSSNNERWIWIHEYRFMNDLCKWHENVIPCADVITITTALTLSRVNSSTGIFKGIQGYPLGPWPLIFQWLWVVFFNSSGLWVLCILLTCKYECYNVIEMDLKHLWCDIDRLKFSPWWWLFINILGLTLYFPYLWLIFFSTMAFWVSPEKLSPVF